MKLFDFMKPPRLIVYANDVRQQFTTWDQGNLLEIWQFIGQGLWEKVGENRIPAVLNFDRASAFARWGYS